MGLITWIKILAGLAILIMAGTILTVAWLKFKARREK
jgi:hypothetical protein